jgi:hypothetical protein
MFTTSFKNAASTKQYLLFHKSENAKRENSNSTKNSFLKGYRFDLSSTYEYSLKKVVFESDDTRFYMLHEDGSFSVIEYDNTGTITTTQTYNVATGLSNPLLAGIIAVKKGVIVGSNSSSK